MKNNKKRRGFARKIMAAVLTATMLLAIMPFGALTASAQTPAHNFTLADGRAEIIPPIYDRVYDFTEGLARIVIDGKYGFIDKTGREVVPPKYDFAEAFSDGMAAVLVGQRYRGGLWGFIDKNGNEVIPPQYREVYSFSDGLARIMDATTLYIDTTGKVIISFENYFGIYGHDFSNGLARTTTDSKSGFIDKNGREVVPPIYDMAFPFSNGFAIVSNDNKYGFIDTSGNVVVPLIYDFDDGRQLNNFSEGLARVMIDGKWGFIDTSGNVVIPAIYEEAEPFSEGLARVMLSGRYGFINKNGATVIPATLEYDWVSSFADGLALVRRNNKYGFIDKNGVEVIPLLYDYAHPFSEGFAAVSVGGNRGTIMGSISTYRGGIWGFIDISGIVVPLKYNAAYPFADGMARVMHNGKWGFIGATCIPIYASGNDTTVLDLSTASSWAVENIQRADSLNLIPANLNDAFTQAITRAEFSALAVALYEKAIGREITDRMTFNDTTDVNVQKMGGLHVVTALDGGNFAPDDALTREQAALILSNLRHALGQPLPEATPTFADNDNISSWAFGAVGRIQAAGIMSDVGDNRFDPQGTYTREQSIMAMLRLFDILY